MPEKFMFSDFQAQLNQEFSIEAAPGQWEAAELVEARELEYTYAPAGDEPVKSFSLVFRAGSNVHLSQGSYPLKHAKLGDLQIFLVPLGPEEGGTFYEAVFT